LKDVPAMKEIITKRFSSSTWVFYRNSFRTILKTSNASKSEWIRIPFASNVSGITTCEQEHLVYICCDEWHVWRR